MSRTAVWLPRIFWIDGLAGLVVGLFVLLFCGFLAELYGLPHSLVKFMGVTNVLYSLLALTLAMQQRRACSLIVTLAAANLVWACVCLLLIVRFLHVATPIGLAVLALECLFVAVLAYFEWRYRMVLLTAAVVPI